jgi:hypothetical protein
VPLPDYDDDDEEDVTQVSGQRNGGNAMRDDSAKRMWVDYERTRRRTGQRRVAR